MDIPIPSRFRVNKESLAWVLFLFLLASLALYYFSFIDNSWAPTPDSAYYVSLAQSIAHGKGYTFDGQAHVKYPPGLPLLLAPSYLFKKPYLYDHVVMVLFVLGILTALYVGFRRQIGIFSCLLMVALIGCSYWFWQFSCVFILSDVPFTALVLFTCLAGRVFLDEPSPSWRLSLVLAVLLILSCLIRTIGIVLFPALIGAALVKNANREQWKKTAAILTLGILVLGGWALRNHFVGQQIPFAEDTYIEQLLWKDPYNMDEGRMTLGAIPQRITTNLVHYAIASEALFLNNGRKSSSGISIIGFFILMLVLGRSFLQLWKNGELQDFFVIIYFSFLLLWPRQGSTRFLLPIFIFLLYSLWKTGREIFAWAPARLTKSLTGQKLMQKVLVALAVLLCLGLSAKGISEIHASRKMKDSVVSHASPLVTLGEWLREESQTSPVVFSNVPSIAYRLMGAHVIAGEYSSFFLKNLKRIDESSASYAVIRESHKADQAFLVLLVRCFPDVFSLKKREGDFLLYEVNRAEMAAINYERIQSWNSKTIVKEYGENLLSNGGFELSNSEENLKNWINCQSARIDREVFYEGQASLSAEISGGETVNWYFPSQTVSVKPGRLYRLSGFVKGKGVNGAMMIEAQHARSYKEGLWRTLTYSGTFDWRQVEVEFAAPPGTEKIRIYPIRVPHFKKGQVWVDQLVFEEVVYRHGGMVSSF